MRRAPCPARTHDRQPVNGPVALDAPAWELRDGERFGRSAGQYDRARKTTLRTLYDETRIYLRFESDLPADWMNRTLGATESLVIYLTPSWQGHLYRFMVGPGPNRKPTLASGLVTDAMDPRYGQYDPDWSGDWAYETRLEPEGTAGWLAGDFFPDAWRRTAGGGDDLAGQFRAGSFAGPDQIERSIWSAAISTKSWTIKAPFRRNRFCRPNERKGKSECVFPALVDRVDQKRTVESDDSVDAC